MKLATFTHQGDTRIGVVDGTAIIDLAAAAPELPTGMAAFLGAGEAAMAIARAADGPRLARAEVRLEAPVARPGKFLAVGLNYADHIAEMGLETPDFPNCFAKLATAINGPYDPIERPKVSDSLDYEAELGFVIGKRCRHVPRDRAAEVIAGYVVVNDVSVRQWQRLTSQVASAGDPRLGGGERHEARLRPAVSGDDDLLAARGALHELGQAGLGVGDVHRFSQRHGISMVKMVTLLYQI